MNPMQLFNKDLSPEKLQALMQLHALLGGLGGQPASKMLSPSLTSPPMQPEVSKERPILGGTLSG